MANKGLISGNPDSAAAYLNDKAVQEIANNSKRIDTVSGVATYASVTATSAVGRLNVLEPIVATKANATDLNATNNRVTAVEGDIVDLENADTALSNRITPLETFKTNVDSNVTFGGGITVNDDGVLTIGSTSLSEAQLQALLGLLS